MKTSSEHFGYAQSKHFGHTQRKHSRNNGLLIFLEGVDGCGKGTQLAMLKKRLEKDHIPFLLTKEPGPKTCLGEPIRQILQYNKGK